jgi:UDP-N-acetylglucosamine 2-epimerase (non-hydrolysing)
MEQFDLLPALLKNRQILITEPLSYFFFLKIISRSALVITDSGGVQEETSFLNIPCVTFRKNTERPVTVELGTNQMMDIWDDAFAAKIKDHLQNQSQKKRMPIPLWDENVSQRISDFITSHL